MADSIIRKDICGKTGHNLTSLQTDIVKDEVGLLIPRFIIVCTKCGVTWDQLSNDNDNKW